jgi:hypothetical protein
MATKVKALKNLRVSEECDSTSDEFLPVCHECECSVGLLGLCVFPSCDPNLCLLSHPHISSSDTSQCCASSLLPSRPVPVGPTSQSVIWCYCIHFISSHFVSSRLVAYVHRFASWCSTNAFSRDCSSFKGQSSPRSVCLPVHSSWANTLSSSCKRVC